MKGIEYGQINALKYCDEQFELTEKLRFYDTGEH
jgi:hypothetical protein